MSRFKRLARRPAQVTGLLSLVQIKTHLEEVEESFAENARHERLLVREVDRIEAAVGTIAANWERTRARGSEEGHPEP